MSSILIKLGEFMNQSNKRKFYIDKTLVTILIIFAIVSVVSIYCAQPIMQSYLRDSNLFIKQASNKLH